MPAASTTIDTFRFWLETKSLSRSTVRNYLVDVNRYLNWVETSQTGTGIFSEPSLSGYVATISSDRNFKRYAASLNQFCRYGLDQHLVDHNPLKKILKNLNSVRTELPDLDLLLRQYRDFLKSKGKSDSTIKNYLNDIQQFINWTEAGN